MNNQNFINRHIGQNKIDENQMLVDMSIQSIDELINQTIPKAIRFKDDLRLGEGMSEYAYLAHIKEIASQNKVFKSYIGLGYYNTITPSVILRNVFENPGWYTSYTPYQAEISQGRLEALLNFQTMVLELTQMEIANCSLLDEGTAAAESMMMLYNSRSKDAVKKGINTFFVANHLFPQTIDILKTRASALGIDLVVDSYEKALSYEALFGAIVQFPTQTGAIVDYSSFIKQLADKSIPVVVAADLLSLTLLTPPGEWGADIVIGSTQRFGIPMGFGGPHAAYLACKETYKRSMPGRIIGVSVDKNGQQALRMALQTREQHIKREKATSNICTAQALLATMAGFYAAYHGPEGLKNIANQIHLLAETLASALKAMGCKLSHAIFFDTLEVSLPSLSAIQALKKEAESQSINFRYTSAQTIGISLDETTTLSDIQSIVAVFASVLTNSPVQVSESSTSVFPTALVRTSPFLTQPVFNTYHSETAMMRYLKLLENKDLALNRTMIPLGSCTMKLNAATQMIPLSWPEFGQIHPFVPLEQARGYHTLIASLEKDLAAITGFSAISFQPNSGSAGEYAGLMVIRAYHQSKGEGNRHIILIPSSAHGTNPASAVLAGGTVVVVKCDEQGNIDLTDLTQKVAQYASELSCLMLTYPSTHGVFEENVLDIIQVVHQVGGQVYMDGANMNAQVGYTSPGYIGADVCHLNLHKTFAIPHGGGGPGVGPIGVAKHLVPFLPSHVFEENGSTQAISAVSSAPFGSPLVLPISYAYIKLLGAEGLKKATAYAIFNANYLKAKLSAYYPILYMGKNGHVAHEMILDCNGINKETGIGAIDIAKRLMDYGFHAPTVAFPVAGTLMVEPTESEPKEELDRFVEAMIQIKMEINSIKDGRADKGNNVIKNAPHTVVMGTENEWSYPYSRQEACFPVESLKSNKYWAPVTRIDDAYGDRNLVCACGK